MAVGWVVRRVLPFTLCLGLCACTGPRIRMPSTGLSGAKEHRLQVSTHHLRAAGYSADIEGAAATIRHQKDPTVRTVSCTGGAGSVACTMDEARLDLSVRSEAGDLAGTAGPYTVRSTRSLAGGIESADVAGLWIGRGDTQLAAVQLYGPYFVWLPETLGPERDEIAAWALVLAWVAPTIGGEVTPERASWPAPPP